jgi:hypothetical protein
MYIQEELLEETDNIINKETIPYRARTSWFGVPKWVTEYDLKKATGFEQSGEVLLDSLYELGIDSKSCAVIEQICLHRPDFFPTTGMYKGKQKKQSRAVSDTKDTADFQSAKGGSTPTTALQSTE